MKTVLLFLLVAFTINTEAQTLTQTYNEPKVGDVDVEWLLDTTAFTTGMPLGITGTNCAWNFSALKTTSLVSINYLQPSAVPASSAYAGCNVVQQSGNSYTFLKSVTTPTSQTEVLGMDIILATVNLTNPAIAAKYPVSYNFSLTDNVSGTFSSTLASGSCTGSLVTKADGLGTLTLPNGIVLPNVLRVKSVLNLSMQSGIIPLATAKQTIYGYYHSSQKFPILNLTYTAYNIILTSTSSLSGVANGNGYVLLGLEDRRFIDESLLKVYPNPSGGDFRLDGELKNLTTEVKIYSLQGELVSWSNDSVDRFGASLPAGVYLVELVTDKGIIHKKIIKQ